MKEDDILKIVIAERDKAAEFAKNTRKVLKSSDGSKILKKGVYTNTDFDGPPWVDEGVINIPEGWDYYNDKYWETTGLGDRKVYAPTYDRDPKHQSRIIAVHIKVEAFARSFARSWVGAELDVTIVPEPPDPKKSE